jgi:FkbM family methyltransferase
MKKELLKFYRIVLKYGPLTAIKISTNINSNRNIELNLKDIAHPITLRGIKNDMLAFYEVFVLEGYKLKLNFKPSIIIDGGANIGLTTIFYKNQYPDAKIITIEPDKSNFELLEKNLKFYSNIFNINTGLWNKNSLIKIVDKYGFGKSGLVTEEYNKDNSESNQSNILKTITVDEIVNDFKIQRIDILKLDIETSEKYLFSENYTNWLSITKVVIIELHEWIEKDSSKPFWEAINKTFKKYSSYQQRECTVIVNETI